MKMLRRFVLPSVALALLSAGCEREMRRFDVQPEDTPRIDGTRMGSLRAGPAAPAASAAPASASASAASAAATAASAATAAATLASGASAASAGIPDAASIASAVAAAQPAGTLAALGVANRHEENAYAVSQGKRLFRWYNCSGCHANGGGGMGPPLMDDKWRYGAEPAQIVATILQGRPNGMPSFGGRIPEDQVWQIAAYVRSMSGQLRTDVAPSRGDALSSGPPELRRDKLEPKQAGSGH